MESKKEPTELSYSFKDGKRVEIEISRKKLRFYEAIKELIISTDALSNESEQELPMGISIGGYEITINKSK